MGSIGRSNNLSSYTDEELDRLYETAVANRDRESVMNILSELNRRTPEETQGSINYTSSDIRRRGARGRK